MSHTILARFARNHQFNNAKKYGSFFCGKNGDAVRSMLLAGHKNMWGSGEFTEAFYSKMRQN